MSVIRDHLRDRMPRLSKREVSYPWEQWLYTDYFFEDRPPEFEAFLTLSGLANRAAATALGEFAAERLAASAKSKVVQDYLNAAWVTQIRRRSCDYVVLDQSDWSGPWDGALRAAMLIVNDTVFEAEEDFQFAKRAAWALTLARHICPPEDRAPFETWVSGFIPRLCLHHTSAGPSASGIFDLHFSFGAPVDPDLFVISGEYHAEGAEYRIAAHEARISGQNQFYHPGVGDDAAPDRR